MDTAEAARLMLCPNCSRHLSLETVTYDRRICRNPGCSMPYIWSNEGTERSPRHYDLRFATEAVWRALEADDTSEVGSTPVGVEWLLELNHAVAHLRAALTQYRSQSMNPQATAGRIVHFYYNNAAAEIEGPRAAVICEDTPPDGTAEIQVFGTRTPYGGYNQVPYSEQPAVGCWSWMPYQKAKAATPEGNVSESAEPRPPRGGHLASMPEAEQRAPSDPEATQ